VEIIYSPEAQEDIAYWKKSGTKKIMDRISSLITAIEQDPYRGIGKPEPLKHLLSGCWSRRINKEHRLVYRTIDKKKVEVISMRFHYDR
jgi:toxin YoeB